MRIKERSDKHLKNEAHIEHPLNLFRELTRGTRRKKKTRRVFRSKLLIQLNEIPYPISILLFHHLEFHPLSLLFTISDFSSFVPSLIQPNLVRHHFIIFLRFIFFSLISILDVSTSQSCCCHLACNKGWNFPVLISSPLICVWFDKNIFCSWFSKSLLFLIVPPS